MTADFGGMIVTAEFAVPIAPIVAALDLLAHRWPGDFSSLINPPQQFGPPIT